MSGIRRLVRPLGAALVSVSLASAAAAQVTVTQADIGDTWFLNDTRADGSVSFSLAPASPPLGVGSARMDTNCTTPPGCSGAKAQLFTDVFGTFLAESTVALPVPNPDRPAGGLRLADINAMRFWSWRATTNTNPAAQVVGLNMEVDINSDGLGDTTLVYEPIYNAVRQGPIVPGAWQDWDAYDSGLAIWWSTRNIPGLPAFTFSTTWAQIVALHPSSRIVRFIGFNVGSGWAGMSQNAADGLLIGTSTEGTYEYDFELSRSVRIDVRPNNSENQINTRARQLVPIAILSETDWDACAEVDAESVDVRGAAASLGDIECEDVDNDGIDDLVLRFRARDMEDPTAEECDNPDAKLLLTGATIVGMPFSGTDDVTWSGPACD